MKTKAYVIETNKATTDGHHSNFNSVKMAAQSCINLKMNIYACISVNQTRYRISNCT